MRRLLLFLCLFLPLSANRTAAADEVGVTKITVNKSARKMYLYSGDDIIREYKIRLGGNPVGAKVKEGDNRTPEGEYFIISHNPHSAYHLSLKIS